MQKESHFQSAVAVVLVQHWICLLANTSQAVKLIAICILGRRKRVQTAVHLLRVVPLSPSSVV